MRLDKPLGKLIVKAVGIPEVLPVLFEGALGRIEPTVYQAEGHNPGEHRAAVLAANAHSAPKGGKEGGHLSRQVALHHLMNGFEDAFRAIGSLVLKEFPGL